MSSFIPKRSDTVSSSDPIDTAIENVTRWLNEVVIKQNFCPYAKSPFVSGTVRFSVTQTENTELLLETLGNELQKLSDNPNIETTLIIIERYLNDFYDYLDVLEMAQTCLTDWGYEGEYQLASFHPRYLFEGENPQSASHYTNRSPYPIIHIIREKSINEIIKFDDQGDKIAQRNIRHANHLGAEFFKRYLP